MNTKIEQHYEENHLKFELTWSPYFHYGVFAKTNDFHSAQEYTLDLIAGLASISESTKVLDIGSGIGSSCIYLAKKYSFRITGIDPIEGAIAYSNKRAKADNLENLIDFRCGAAEKLAFDDANFDVVISNEVFCHVKDKLKTLRECHRVLRKNGRIVFSDLYDKTNGTPTAPFHKYTKSAIPMIDSAEYQTIIKEAGFEILEIQDCSSELPKNYEMALILTKRNKLAIVKNFGEGVYNSTKEFYELCLTRPIKEGLGWAIYSCRKIS